MKILNVKWVPGTFAIVSLTVATSQNPAPVGRQSQTEVRPLASAANTKLIVISGGKKLKADVRMAA